MSGSCSLPFLITYLIIYHCFVLSVVLISETSTPPCLCWQARLCEGLCKTHHRISIILPNLSNVWTTDQESGRYIMFIMLGQAIFFVMLLLSLLCNEAEICDLWLRETLWLSRRAPVTLLQVCMAKHVLSQHTQTSSIVAFIVHCRHGTHKYCLERSFPRMSKANICVSYVS